VYEWVIGMRCVIAPVPFVAPHFSVESMRKNVWSRRSY
jgi:hypothetical protein